jgi:hypothetical protein
LEKYFEQLLNICKNVNTIQFDGYMNCGINLKLPKKQKQEKRCGEQVRSESVVILILIGIKWEAVGEWDF